MKSLRSVIFLAAFACLPSVQAEIYKCTDESGISTFTDNPRSVPGKHCSSMNLEPVIIRAPSMPGRKTRSGGGTRRANATASPSDFPRVDSTTQSKRDQTRRQILQDELDGEQRLLSDSQRNLDQSQKNNDAQRTALLRDEVVAHQKNIEALQKELRRAR